MNDRNRGWVAAFLLLGIAFLSAIFAAQGALLTAMIDAYALRASSQGAANAAAFAGGLAALVTAFFLQGRKRKRTLLKWAIALCVAALVLLWLAPGYALFSAVWFALGYGLGLMDTLLSACMADLYTGDAGTRMMCLLHTAFGLTSVLTPMGYRALMDGGMGWKQVYLVIAASGAALLAVAAVVRRLRGIEDREPLGAPAGSLGDIAAGIRQGRLMLLVLAMLFHGVFLSGLNTWVNRYADGLGGSFAIPAQSCLFFGIMLSRLLMPFLPVRPKDYVRVGGLLGGAVLAVGLLVGGGMALRIALALAGLLAGALIPCTLILGCERQRQNTLLATTAMMLALYAGQAVSSPLIAALESGLGLRAGMLLCAACMALCSGCCVLDGRKA